MKKPKDNEVFMVRIANSFINNTSEVLPQHTSIVHQLVDILKRNTTMQEISYVFDDEVTPSPTTVTVWPRDLSVKVVDVHPRKKA